jgi:hypothetical protein
MKNKRNKSYPNKEIEADINSQGGFSSEEQKTMLMVNKLKSLWYVTNTSCVNSHYGKNLLSKEEHKIIRSSITKLIQELEPIVRPSQEVKEARAKANRAAKKETKSKMKFLESIKGKTEKEANDLAIMYTLKKIAEKEK